MLNINDILSSTLEPADVLRLCDLLEAIQTALWRVHGHAINLLLEGQEPAAISDEDDSSWL